MERRILIKLPFIFIGFILIFSMLGCGSLKSYVDPQYGRATYDEIIRRSEPYKLRIIVKFQRNGKHFQKFDSELLGHVESVVRTSGFATPVTEDMDGELKVIVNNIGNMKKAWAKGFVTSLTFGLIGSTVTDFYEMRAILSVDDKVIERKEYKHAIHTTVGLKNELEGLEPMSPSAAITKVIEQLILNFLEDAQNSGELLSYRVQEKMHNHMIYYHIGGYGLAEFPQGSETM